MSNTDTVTRKTNVSSSLIHYKLKTEVEINIIAITVLKSDQLEIISSPMSVFLNKKKQQTIFFDNKIYSAICCFST